MRVLAAFACALLLICPGVIPGHAEKRVALIIGNGDYAHADKLANPVTDARRLQDALDKLHFEIVYGENLGKQALERTIGRFATADGSSRPNRGAVRRLLRSSSVITAAAADPQNAYSAFWAPFEVVGEGGAR